MFERIKRDKRNQGDKGIRVDQKGKGITKRRGLRGGGGGRGAVRCWGGASRGEERGWDCKE